MHVYYICVCIPVSFPCSVHRHETVNVHLKRKPSWLLERNPKGRVPVLEHPDGRIVFESITVCQYLDEIYPQDRLIPIDPYRKARDSMLVDYCDKVPHKLQTKLCSTTKTFTEIVVAAVIFRNAAP